MNSNKIMLHACCAVCATHPLNELTLLGYIPVVLFYNPNIHPREEYEKRLSELMGYCKKTNTELLIEEESPDVWFNYVKGLENEPERGLRCDKCFEMRLNKTALIAEKLGIKHFTTTLSISPHKNFEQICKAGFGAERPGVKFVDINFKKKDGYLKACLTAKEENFYRQTYCGCIYSERSRVYNT